ncbi:DEHA2D11814p [Debaryomyces hansenii CBS767]|uniref:DEHA2D11814p n=1 Tax=Debaryomyces hansenii (strain ATCC 36239 / CBS 767 / BCRC 21394 / JCM 1990 / NBRC 0083 / IGC 2968) TaxID=284592 RepID=Q6BS38_DEBHA|nr:DEHA2D11814p [Debaryomyces hansenii CBS767]CAG87148.2 DEHA2D11814p [Debaryomyces hansenii CBS767]|eukprot:XP_458982.2 DEHA2D11814p [Debaryomyces hansenii CBS767]
MGWSDYLAAAGCLGTAVTYELYRSKVTEYENILIELYVKIEDLELQLEQECLQANSTFNIEQKDTRIDYSTGALSSEASDSDELKRRLAKFEEANQVLRGKVSLVRREKVELEERLKQFQGKIEDLESSLKKSSSEKISLKESYQFKLNNEIERLITSRDLEIANLHDTVKRLNKEMEQVGEINSTLSDAKKKYVFEIDQNAKEISLLKKQKAGDEQNLESLNKKLGELESLNEQNKIDLNTKGKELDKNGVEILELTQELKNNKEELSKLLSEIEDSEKNITGKEELLSIGNQEIEELKREIEHQTKLLESKSESLNKTLEAQDEFMTKYKEFGCEIAKLFEEVTEIEKYSSGTSGNSDEDSKSEEFEFVKYNDSKRSSEDFEEVDIADANKTSSESSDKEHEQDKEYSSIQKEKEKSESSDGLQDRFDEPKGAEPSSYESFGINLRKIQRVREYIKNSRSTINDQLYLRQDKRRLIEKLNAILGDYKAKLASSPEETKKLEDETKFVEPSDCLNDQVAERQLENNLKSIVHQASERESQIKTLESKLADFSDNLKDIDHLKQMNERLEQVHNDYKKTLNAKESEIDRLSKEIAKLPTATREISNLNAELSAKDKQILTLESDIQRLSHDNEQSGKSKVQMPATHDETSASRSQSSISDDDTRSSTVEFQTSPDLTKQPHLPDEQKGHVHKSLHAEPKSPPDSAPNEPSGLPETEIDISTLSSHAAKRIANESEVTTNKELVHSKNPVPVSEENDAYQHKIDQLTRQLQQANQKIDKQHKVISKNLELLKESRTRSSSPMSSPTKN